MQTPPPSPSEVVKVLTIFLHTFQNILKRKPLIKKKKIEKVFENFSKVVNK